MLILTRLRLVLQYGVVPPLCYLLTIWVRLWEVILDPQSLIALRGNLIHGNIHIYQRGKTCSHPSSAFSNLPTYYLSLYKAPIAICNLIERKMRSFYGKVLIRKEAHTLFDGKLITRLKEKGGLGIDKVRITNQVLSLENGFGDTTMNLHNYGEC